MSINLPDEIESSKAAFNGVGINIVVSLKVPGSSGGGGGAEEHRRGTYVATRSGGPI